LGFEGNLKCDTVLKTSKVLKIGFNKFKSIAGYKNTSLLHLCVKGQMVYRVRKNAALLFYLRLYGILLKYFLMNETGYQETGYLMGG